MALSSGKRKQLVIKALRELGGTATIRAIAEKVGLNVNGVSQTIGSIDMIDFTAEGRAGDRVCKFTRIVV